MGDTLHQGPFELCSSVWDNELQEYKISNNTEKINCCLNNCHKLTSNCIQECSKASNLKIEDNCYNICNGNNNTCSANCTLISNFWSLNNPIFKSTMYYNCGNGFEIPINTECMNKNKDDIIKYCTQQCIPSSDNSCVDECKFSFDFLTRKTVNPFNISTSHPQIYRNKQQNGEKNNIIIYITYAVSIAVLFLGIYILFS